MPYRIRTHRLFLTYPQCDVPLQEIFDWLMVAFTPDNLLVAHELHANGDYHRHCYLEKASSAPKWEFTSPNFADLPSGHHGNYQSVRSDRNVLKYCMKKEDYICSVGFEPESRIKARTGHKAYIGAELILKKRPLVELTMENPELIYEYHTLRKNLLLFKYDKQDQRESLPYYIPNPWGRVLLSKRNAKRRHYWIYSRAYNKGKTRNFALPLSRSYKAEIISRRDPSYWNVKQDTECIILDAYNSAKLKFDDLECMADGTFTFRVIYIGEVMLDNPLIIVLSNQPIVDIYPFMHNMLYERFIEIEIL